MDPRACELAEESYEDIMRIVSRMRIGFRNRDEARSISNIALCEAASVWVEKGYEGDFAKWASVFVRRRVVDEWRRIYGRKETSTNRMYLRQWSLDKKLNDGETELSDLVGLHDDNIAWAIEEMNACEFWDMVEQEVLQKHLNQRELYVLRRLVDGCNLAEIGRELGVTESRVCQIRRKLKDGFATFFFEQV